MNRLDSARAMIRYAVFGRELDANEDRVLVGVSGGKDSIVTLDLAVSVLGASRVVPFFMRIVEGLECETGPVRRICARYGLEDALITLPHWTLSRMYRDGVLRLYVDGAENIKRLRMADVEHWLREKTGIYWFAYGHRCVESIVRNAMLKRDGMNGCDWRGGHLYPIWDWKNADVFSYMRSKELPIPKPLGPVGVNRNGFSLTPEFLMWLRDTWPEDYARVCKVFPLAPAQIARFEMHGRGGMNKIQREKLAPASKETPT